MNLGELYDRASTGLEYYPTLIQLTMALKFVHLLISAVGWDSRSGPGGR